MSKQEPRSPEPVTAVHAGIALFEAYTAAGRAAAQLALAPWAALQQTPSPAPAKPAQADKPVKKPSPITLLVLMAVAATSGFVAARRR